MSEFRKPIDFNQYLALLNLLASTLNELQIEKMEKRLKIVKKLIKQNEKKLSHINTKLETVKPKPTKIEHKSILEKIDEIEEMDQTPLDLE